MMSYVVEAPLWLNYCRTGCVWAIIDPLLPPVSAPSAKGGRPALTGIRFVLKTGLPWEDLPAEMNCESGMSCWRRLREGHADGTWDEIHALRLDHLDATG